MEGEEAVIPSPASLCPSVRAAWYLSARLGRAAKAAKPRYPPAPC